MAPLQREKKTNVINDIGLACDAPPSSLMYSTASPKVKIAEGERVGACSLACSTSGVEGRARAPGWD